ncbi:MFS general substrate transporter [Armillaria nabsnona]|nr:MFS general substrate transporter [Armillaria nabsnona]
MPSRTTKSDRSQFNASRDASACPILPDDKKDGETGIVNAEDDFSSAAEKRWLQLLRRLDLRFIPGFMLMYTLCFVAGANIGNVRILNADTGDSLLQLPFIIFGWGATEMIMAISQNYNTLLGLRFLLGVFQAERGLRLSSIIAAGPLGSAFGGVIAYALFIIEGGPLCLLAIVVYLFLPSYPEKAGWLSSDDRAMAILRMKQETSKSLGHATVTWQGAKSTLGDWRLYLHHLVSILVSVPMTSVVVFTPTIIFTVPPFALAFSITVTMSWVADRYRMWSTWSIVSMAFAGMTFIKSSGILPPTAFKARYAMLCLGTTFIYASYPSFLTWFTGNLRDTNATTLAIPMNLASATFGEIIGMFICKSAEAPGYPTGHFTNGAVLFAGTICLGALRVIYKKRNRGLAVEECPWIT